MFAESSSSRAALHHSSRFRIEQRYPTRFQWQMLDKFQGNLMEPETFLARWEVTYKQLAKICCTSETTVKAWFLKTPNRRKPNVYHKFCLALTNKLWTDIVINQERS
jgi:hypothetical protein